MQNSNQYTKGCDSAPRSGARLAMPAAAINLRWTLRSAALVILILLLASCGLSPQYARPELDIPRAYEETGRETLREYSAENRAWWQGFASKALPSLQAVAIANNHAFQAERQVLAQSFAQARAARASLFPSIDVGGSGSHKGNAVPGGYSKNDALSGTVQASYEVDIWGKNYETATAQSYRAIAGVNAWRGAGLTLESEVALTYFSYLAARENLAVYNAMLENAKDVLEYQEKREKLGAAAPLDVARQRASVESMEAGRISYLVNMTEAKNSLAQLVGSAEIPADIMALMDAENLMDMLPPAIDAGIPADLLARRPDIAEAEARLMAANANIGVARAAFLPGVSLTASAGWQSDSLSTLISPSSALFSLAGSLLQPLFQGGRLIAQYDEAVAANKELMERYREAALAGYLEVATTLETNVLLVQQEKHRHLSAGQSEEAYRIARLRYEAGAEDFLAVLNAQETKLNAESQVVQTRLERLNTAIALFKALGGGWMNETAPTDK